MDEVAEQPGQAMGLAEDGEPRAQDRDGNFHVDDEASRLKDLAADVRDQDDLERDVGRQVRRFILPQLYVAIS